MMQFQAALSKSSLKGFSNNLRLFLVPAMHQPIIRMPTPGHAGKRPRHPEIERIMHEEIGENRADHTHLRGSAASLEYSPIFEQRTSSSVVVRGTARLTMAFNLCRAISHSWRTMSHRSIGLPQMVPASHRADDDRKATTVGQLAHGERKVRAAYNHAQYLPERRRMMQQWADYLDDPAEGGR
jgi:hypothetical protein